MTGVPVDDPNTLRRILANTEALLLDFDGPICSVFAGFPASAVAAQLREILSQGGFRNLPATIARSHDPFDVLKYAATLGDHEARYVEAAFRAHELEAISTATPTVGAVDFINRWKSTGRRIAIVSNNSDRAISAYLQMYAIYRKIDYVSARRDATVTHLKPNPYLLIEAAKNLGAATSRCTLVGDSTTDVKAALSAKSQVIGYANKPSKVITLQGAHAISTSIELLATSALA